MFVCVCLRFWLNRKWVYCARKNSHINQTKYTNSYFTRPGQFSKCVCMKIKQFLCLRHTNSVSRTQMIIRMPANGNTPVIIWTKNTPPNIFETFICLLNRSLYSRFIYMHMLCIYVYTLSTFNKRIWCWMSFIEEEKNDELLSQRIKTHVEKIHSREVTNCYTLFRMYVFLCCFFVSFKWIDMTHKWSKQ